MCPKYNSPEDSGKAYDDKKSNSQDFNSQKRNSGSGNKNSHSQDFSHLIADTDAPKPHVCSVRSCRSRCLAWKTGSLPLALRWFAKNHDWHNTRPLANQLKLMLVFESPTHTTANKLLAVGLDGLAAQIKADFNTLLEMCPPLDVLCGKQIGDEDKLLTLEHSQANLAKRLNELAGLIESGCLTGTRDQTGKSGDACCRSQKQSSRKIVDIPPDGDDGVAGCKKRRRRKTTKTKGTAGTAFNQWAEEKAACFTYQSGGVYFCCNNECKKIPFRSNSQAPLVLGGFLDGPVSGEKIKGLTKTNSGPSQIVRNINRTINAQLRKIGFTDIRGVQFIYFDNGSNAYRLKPDILEHALYLTRRENNFK